MRRSLAAVALSSVVACGGAPRAPKTTTPDAATTGPRADGGDGPAAADAAGAIRTDVSLPDGAPSGDRPVLLEASPGDRPADGVGDGLSGGVDGGSDAVLDGGASDLRVRPDVAGPPAELRGTPVITDPGAGPARAGAGFYRLAFQAWAPGLTFPADTRTTIDFYYSSDQDVFSNGLGDKPARVPVPTGQALVYRAPYGDELDLVLDTARVAPFTFMQAFLRERGTAVGTDDQFPYPGVVNKVAEPPFAGGPRQAPSGAFVPGVFALATAAAPLKCTSAAVLQGQDSTFTLDKSYEVALAREGSARIATNATALVRAWSELTDTYAWPDATGSSSLRFIDAAGAREIVVRHDGRRVVEVTWTVTRADLFASYTLSAM